eukprot:4428741-Heterocapsa_arctica.AAC.1
MFAGENPPHINKKLIRVKAPESNFRIMETGRTYPYAVCPLSAPHRKGGIEAKQSTQHTEKMLAG